MTAVRPPLPIEKLHQLFCQTLRLPAGVELTANEPLFPGRFGLDSVDSVALLTAVEREFAISVDETDLVGQPLANLTSLAELVARKLA